MDKDSWKQRGRSGLWSSCDDRMDPKLVKNSPHATRYHFDLSESFFPRRK